MPAPTQARPTIRVPRPWLLLLATLFAWGCSATGAKASEADRIARSLGLRPGLVVADVGAGDGDWTLGLARGVGEAGHVFATEVDEEHVAKIEATLDEAGIDNVTVVLGDQVDTGLPAGCCDAILLRLVYHHFTDPAAMRTSLVRALRPGGRITVIDTVPQTNWRDLPGVPDRGGHGIPPDQLVAEMASDGFQVEERIDDWNGDEDRFCLVFTRGTAAPAPPAPAGSRSSGP